MQRVTNGKKFKMLAIILECALFCIAISQQYTTTQLSYSTSNNTQSVRLTGPINSLQFSTDGNVLWIVSGRWRMEMVLDNNGVVPVEIKSFNATIITVSKDGSDTGRFELSDFKQDAISYDNKTLTSSIKGKLTMPSKTQPIEDIDVLLNFTNKNILTIALDPSKTRDEVGETPIYGVER